MSMTSRGKVPSRPLRFREVNLDRRSAGAATRGRNATAGRRRTDRAACARRTRRPGRAPGVPAGRGTGEAAAAGPPRARRVRAVRRRRSSRGTNTPRPADTGAVVREAAETPGTGAARGRWRRGGRSSRPRASTRSMATPVRAESPWIRSGGGEDRPERGDRSARRAPGRLRGIGLSARGHGHHHAGLPVPGVGVPAHAVPATSPSPPGVPPGEGPPPRHGRRTSPDNGCGRG